MESGDVSVLVGPQRKPFIVSAEVLANSQYFKALLGGGSTTGVLRDAVAVDCDEHVFRGILRLLRYGDMKTVQDFEHEADKMSFLKEVNFLGIKMSAPAEPISGEPSPRERHPVEMDPSVLLAVDSPWGPEDPFDVHNHWYISSLHYGFVHCTSHNDCEELSGFSDIMRLMENAIQQYDASYSGHYEKATHLLSKPEEDPIKFTDLAEFRTLLITVVVPSAPCLCTQEGGSPCGSKTWAVSFAYETAWCTTCCKLLKGDFKANSRLMLAALSNARKAMEDSVRLAQQQGHPMAPMADFEPVTPETRF